MPNHASLSDWLHDLEHRYQEEIQLGLTRVKVVADKLNIRQLPVPVILVAGTNGKGSTVAALASIYGAAGKQVATYTSPHLFAFNERIKVNQQSISDVDLCHAFQVIEEAREDIHLTYFEMTTLAALWYFKQLPLDLVILEVGMGGRLDATNIIDADLAIITTIDLDHQAYLGTDKETIGYEKAGIMRAGKPCIYADLNPPQRILAHARQLNVLFVCLGEDYQRDHVQNGFEVITEKERFHVPDIDLHPNAVAAAVMASQLLKDLLPVEKQMIHQGMQTASIIGRKQWVRKPIPTLFDVAHNPQAVQLLSKQVIDHKPKGRILAVFSALHDKDLYGLIKPMKNYVDKWYPALLTGKRAASEAMLKEAYQQAEVVLSSEFTTPKEAYQHALLDATEDDLIVVYGSFFMVSETMTNKGNEYEVRN